MRRQWAVPFFAMKLKFFAAEMFRLYRLKFQCIMYRNIVKDDVAPSPGIDSGQTMYPLNDRVSST